MSMLKISFDRVLLYTTSVLTFSLCVFFGIRSVKRQQAVFVDIGKLVASYQFKKDLESTSTRELYRLRNISDSLKVIQKIASPTERLRIDTTLSRLSYAFDQYYRQSNDQISKKVWERLNPVIEAYGKENEMTLIIGANGAGTVLYGSAANDVTEDLIHYVNAKYEKGS